MKQVLLTLFLFLIIGFSVQSCKNDINAPSVDCKGKTSLHINKPSNIELSKVACNSRHNLRLQALNVEDSRCPEGVQCFWAGNASVEFHLTTKKAEYYFSLNTFNGKDFTNDTIIEGLKYHLLDVLPYPSFSAPHPAKTINILVEKAR